MSSTLFPSSLQFFHVTTHLCQSGGVRGNVPVHFFPSSLQFHHVTTHLCRSGVHALYPRYESSHNGCFQCRHTSCFTIDYRARSSHTSAQHFGLEFHLVLTDVSCIRRGCYSEGAARRLCTQLERSTLEGLCSCVFDEARVLTLAPTLYLDWVGHPVTATSVV